MTATCDAAPLLPASRLDALCAAPPLRVLPVDVLRFADAFAAFVEGRRVRAFDSAGQFGEGTLAVSVGPAGDVFVADSVECRVRVFRADGTLLHVMGSYGRGPGQLRCPMGICASPADDGDVFVSDMGKGCVQRFSADGAFVRAFVAGGGAAGQLSSPTGLAVSAAGDMFVADSVQNRVNVFRTTDGACVRVLGGDGADDPLVDPWGVAVSAAGDAVFVADCGHNRVCVFRGADGAWLRAFSCSSPDQPQPWRPRYVALTAAGELLVTGAGGGSPSCRVFRAADGAWLREFALGVQTMASVAVAPGGEAVVVGDGRVQIFE